MYYQKQLCLQSAIGAASAPLDKEYWHTHSTQGNWSVFYLHCIVVNYIAKPYIVINSRGLDSLYCPVLNSGSINFLLRSINVMPRGIFFFLRLSRPLFFIYVSTIFFYSKHIPNQASHVIQLR